MGTAVGNAILDLRARAYEYKELAKRIDKDVESGMPLQRIRRTIVRSENLRVSLSLHWIQEGVNPKSTPSHQQAVRAYKSLVKAHKFISAADRPKARRAMKNAAKQHRRVAEKIYGDIRTAYLPKYKE